MYETESDLLLLYKKMCDNTYVFSNNLCNFTKIKVNFRLYSNIMDLENLIGECAEYNFKLYARI